MRKFAIAAAIVCGGVVLYFLLAPPEPTYQGRKITAWQDDWAAQKNRIWPTAVKQIGTNALPYAVRNVALNNSGWRSNYARLQPKLPARLQLVFQKPKPLLQEVDGANVFGSIGSNSIPYAIALTKHD